MTSPPLRLTVLLCLLPAVSFISCTSVHTLDRTLYDSSTRATLNNKSPFLKAHMRDGEVYVLSRWKADSVNVVGWGNLLDINRTPVAQREFTLSVDSVVLFETNVLDPADEVAVLGVISVLSGAMTIYCAANPKACFGSCPTFYVSDGYRDLLQAEGFSASVLPSLEERDIDALFHARPIDGSFAVHMKNEAFETHAVRYVQILACPRSQEARVFATPAGEFWLCREVVRPERCIGPEGDCSVLVHALDMQERFSATDSTDLAARETLYVEFPPVQGERRGLIVASRQSLVSTYLFYQGLAYMGESAGTLLAAMERGDPVMREAYGGMKRALGGITVDVLREDGAWIGVDEILEFGPLASDIRLLPLPEGSHRVRLRCARGSWRIDWLALARMDERVDPIRLIPSATSRRRERGEWEFVEHGRGQIVTVRGEEYKFSFDLPDGSKTYEYFLESKGYYLEWMREEWLSEENPVRAAMMLFDPSGSLKLLAPEYKKQEAIMESEFWRSRYAR